MCSTSWSLESLCLKTMVCRFQADQAYRAPFINNNQIIWNHQHSKMLSLCLQIQVRYKIFGENTSEDEAREMLENDRDDFRKKYGKYVGLKPPCSYTWYLEMDECYVNQWALTQAKEFYGDAGVDNSSWNDVQSFLPPEIHM